MIEWNCASCGCEYHCTDPDESHGVKLCFVCVDDPDKVAKAQKIAKAANPAANAWLFVFGFVAGVIFVKILPYF
jgi:hypothetical protein